MIIGQKTYVDIPGTDTHELPPLLVNTVPRSNRRLFESAQNLIHVSDLDCPLNVLPDGADRRNMDLALNLMDGYLAIKESWSWGDSILEWIRQCETTFRSQMPLRTLLSEDLWPHAGRASFVNLLVDKSVADRDLRRSVGLRLTFQELPPLRCCSDQFIFFSAGPLSACAFESWENASTAAALPPERFHFEVINMAG